MNLTQLLTLTSSRLDDSKVPYRWSDEELTAYANQRLNEICEVVPVLRDALIPTIIPINIVIAKDSYDLDPRVMYIHEVKLDLQATPLMRVTFSEMQEFQPTWRARTGTPSVFLTDVESGHIVITPSPIVIDIMRLNIVRSPLSVLDYKRADECEPEIPSTLHDLLIPGMTALAYRKADAETEDLVRSKTDEEEWLRNLERIKRFYLKFNYSNYTAVPNLAFT